MRLTRSGRAVAAGCVFLLVAGWALGYQEVALWGAACGVAVLLAVVWSLVPVPLAVTRRVDRVRVPKGTPAFGHVTVTNRTRRFTGPLTLVEPVGAARVTVSLGRLAGRSTREASYRLPTERRGVVTVGPLQVVRHDPLALVARSLSAGTSETVWIHPAVLALRFQPPGRFEPTEGAASDLLPVGSPTFQSVREYVAGDDPRLIHWKSSAHHGSLMVRQHIETTEPRTTVLVDTHAEHYDNPERFEQAMDVAASVVVAAVGAGHLVRLWATSGFHTASAGWDPTPCLDALAELQPGGEDRLAGLVHAVAEHTSRSSLVVVTGSVDSRHLRAVGERSPQFQVAVVASLQPIEHPTLSAPAGVTVLGAPDAAGVAEAWHRGARW